MAEKGPSSKPGEGVCVCVCDLRDDILSWQEEIGEQLKYYAVTLWMYENAVNKIDENIQEQIKAITPVFMSVFKQDVGKFGDGLQKLAMQAPEIVRARSLWRNLGLTSTEIDKVVESAVENIV